MKKKGVANVIAYIMLVGLAVAVSGIVFVGLRDSVPDFDVVSCPDATEIYFRNVQCSQKNVCVDLINKGKFTADGYVLRGDNRSPHSYDLYVLNDSGSKLVPGNENSHIFPNASMIPYTRDSESGNLNSLTYLEVQPYIYDEDGKKLLCKEIISVNFECVQNERDCTIPCDLDCDDGNLCTLDSCVGGVCQNLEKDCGPGLSCIPATGECEKKVDIIFLLDNSGSTDSDQFNNLITATRNVIDELKISLDNDATQIGIISYNDTVGDVITLTNDYGELISSLERIDDFPPLTGSNTHLQGALLHAYNMFKNSGLDRPDYKDYVVIVGSGPPNQKYFYLSNNLVIPSSALLSNIGNYMEKNVFNNPLWYVDYSSGGINSRVITNEMADLLEEDLDVTIVSVYVGNDEFLTVNDDITSGSANPFRYFKSGGNPGLDTYYYNVDNYADLVNSLDDIIPIVKDPTDL